MAMLVVDERPIFFSAGELRKMADSCSEFKQILKLVKPELFLTDTTYYIGQEFSRTSIMGGNELYLLCHLESNRAALIKVNEPGKGKPFRCSVQVKDLQKITSLEFIDICGGNPEWFTLRK